MLAFCDKKTFLFLAFHLRTLNVPALRVHAQVCHFCYFSIMCMTRILWALLWALFLPQFLQCVFEVGSFSFAL